jgi:hypothetical protein
MKRNLKIKSIYECRCNERLQPKRFTRLAHTGLVVELEHLKIKTRLTNEKFASAKKKKIFFLFPLFSWRAHEGVCFGKETALTSNLRQRVAW